jgi:hypothetical protein
MNDSLAGDDHFHLGIGRLHDQPSTSCPKTSKNDHGHGGQCAAGQDRQQPEPAAG